MKGVTRGAWLTGMIAGLSVGICGCGDDTSGPGELPGTKTPSGLVAAYSSALAARDLEAYAALLAPEFRFHPPAEALSKLPWMRTAASWDRTTELGMVGHLFDPAFRAVEPGPADFVELDLELLEVVEGEAGAVDVTCAASVRLHEGEAVYGDIRFVFQAQPDDRGDLRIHAIRETKAPGIAPGRDVWVSWAEWKDFYRRASGYTDPAALVAAHGAALSECDVRTYERLLAEDFEFFPPAEDVGDFPWMLGPSWGRADELLMIGRMMDPYYSLPDFGGTVDTIGAELSVLASVPIPEGGTVVTTHATMIVLFDASSGMACDSRWEFRLLPASDGFLKIRSVRELTWGLAPATRSVEDGSWAGMKAIFH